MPKWIMRLVPDVPLGAEVWVSGGAPLGSFASFSGAELPTHLFQLSSSMESEVAW
jgi:hypothetical protein